VDRLACIDLPAFPLQLLLRRHPEWARSPAAVVDEDRPLGRILWVNERARRAGVLPGMRYAAALGLAFDLCAGEVPPAEIETAVSELVELVRRFTPQIEPAAGEPGTLWLGAGGFRRLYPSLGDWAQEILRAVEAAGLRARIAVGMTRFGTFALARAADESRLQVMRSPAEETARARRVRLDRLELDPAVRDRLTELKIETVGAFLDLPPGGIQQRFGPEVLRLHQQARGDLWLPMQSRPEEESLARRQLLDAPENDRNRLLFLVTRLLHPLLTALAARGEALAELDLELGLEGVGGRVERVSERLRPAAPTLDARQLLNLVMLRLERTELGAGVVELTLDALRAPATSEQLQLFAERPRRELEAAGRAFARLRAEFGDDVVVHAVLGDGHLPEASFDWQLLRTAVRAAPREVARRPLVRRVLARPTALSFRMRDQFDGWFLEQRDQTGADLLVGPYVVSGGWWQREVHREYHFVHSRRGEWLWIYFDGRRQRWYLQGRVE
jgi:protein ImuB